MRTGFFLVVYPSIVYIGLKKKLKIDIEDALHVSPKLKHFTFDILISAQ